MAEETLRLVQAIEAGNSDARRELLDRVFPRLFQALEGERFFGQDLIERLSTVCEDFLAEKNNLTLGDLDVVTQFRSLAIRRAKAVLQENTAIKRGGPGRNRMRDAPRPTVEVSSIPDNQAMPEASVVCADQFEHILTRIREEDKKVLFALLDNAGNQAAAAKALQTSRSYVVRAVRRLKAHFQEMESQWPAK